MVENVTLMVQHLSSSDGLGSVAETGSEDEAFACMLLQ
jgi:hypothetical protein